VRGYSTKEFRDLLQRKFGEDLVIQDFEYQGKKTPITLACKKRGHGSFTIQATGIHQSSGCPKCSHALAQGKRTEGVRAANRRNLTVRFENWLKQAKEIYGDRYDYSEVIYKDQKTRVSIGCPVHGFVFQSPANHLKGGCRLCADDELKGLYTENYFVKNPGEKSRPALVYYISFKRGDEEFYKVGITTTSIRNRFSLIPRDRIVLKVLGIKKTSLFGAWRLETEIQRSHGDSFRYRPDLGGISLRKIRIGPSECFSMPLPESIAKKFDC
tara:strand:+ start:483 stop:1292 length:810 start_codon:yes stop_codon:yes gene_type:complete